MRHRPAATFRSAEDEVRAVPAREARADIGLFLLATATLLFEITLTRLFSVAQFYHFAFLIVSLAMLGFGASGTWLALAERQQKEAPRGPFRRRERSEPASAQDRLPAGFALAFGVTSLGAYALVNWLPFDSFSIAWDRRQVLRLSLHYVVLAIPFFCSGAVLSLRFAQARSGDDDSSRMGTIYAYNLSGSAVGAVLALILPRWVGGVGPVWISAALGGLAAWVLTPRDPARKREPLAWAAALLGVTGLALTLLRPDALALNLSPYKGLSYALQVPNAEIIWQGWNGYSRVDLVDSTAIRSLPGLSYRFRQAPPPQRGLSVDGDTLSPVLYTLETPLQSQSDAVAFAAYMPTAIAYRLRPRGRTLILEPRGGLEVWTALAVAHDRGVPDARIVAVTSNPLVAQAAGGYDPAITTVIEDPRSYVRRSAADQGNDLLYDIVTLAMTRPYRPIRSGAYSLGEDYAYTVEAFQDYLGRLAPEGLFVVSSWLQTPPSESLRTFALIVEALEATGGDPAAQVVAFRGYAVMTFLVRERPFSPSELSAIEAFGASRAFDLVVAPGLRSEFANKYNVLPEPAYYEAFAALVAARDREAWYAAYPFDIRPPTDNHPFFGHFFRWSQTGQILTELGKTWQPFGGAGYFVLVALMGLSLLAALILIGLPVLVVGASSATPGSSSQGSPSMWAVLAYFGLLGVGYLFVEIPLMQQTIRFLGHPARAVTAVLGTVLGFSGLGSAFSSRLRARPVWVLGVLVGAVALTAAGLPLLYDALLSLAWTLRLVVTILGLAPLGTLMGVPFPLGLRYLSGAAPGRVPWAWAVNGAISVVASVLAALIALSVGFGWVLVVGAGAYGLAALVTLRWRPET